MWYKHSVCCCDTKKNSNPAVAEKYLLNRKCPNKEWLCRTCHNYLAKNKVPPAAVVNGMHFPPKPDFFDLNELQCRLLAPTLAFQKLMQASRGRQLKINENVVNVPAEVSNTVNMLPRLPTESGTIMVNLKRRLQYKSSALSQDHIKLSREPSGLLPTAVYTDKREYQLMKTGENNAL